MLLTCLLLSGALASGAPYPIDPVPLRRLCEQSDAIVIATVGEIEQLQGEPDMRDLWRQARVELHSVEILHGEPAKEPLSVFFPRYLLCPAPPRFESGERVLTFLREDYDGGYQVCGLSYGTRYSDADGLAAYRQRIAEILELEASSSEKSSLMRARVEWLVRCAEHPATCWDGVYELAVDSRRDDSLYGEHLDESLDERLLEIYLDRGDLEQATICLMELFEESDDPRIVPTLRELLRSVVDDPPATTLAVVEDVARRIDTPGAIEGAKEYAREHRKSTDPLVKRRYGPAVRSTTLQEFLRQAW